MREAGLVTKTDGQYAYILFKRTAACGKCHACGMLSGQGEITIKAKNILGAKKDDRVMVEFSSKNALATSAIAYVFPLAMLLEGLFIGLFLPVEWPLEREPFSAILGLAFTGVAFVILKLANSFFNKKFSDVYKMTEIL